MKNLILIMTILFFLVVNVNAQGNISISQPQNGTRVPQFPNTIKVTVNNGIPAGQCIVVFVQDPNKNWWPYLNVNPILGTNSWGVNEVQYGMPIDRGRQFNIRAIIMSSTVQTNGLNISTNQDGSIRLSNFATFINGINANNYSAIVSVTREL